MKDNVVYSSRIIELYCEAAAVETLVPISQRFHVWQTHQAPQPFAIQKPMCILRSLCLHSTKQAYSHNGPISEPTLELRLSSHSNRTKISSLNYESTHGCFSHKPTAFETQPDRIKSKKRAGKGNMEHSFSPSQAVNPEQLAVEELFCC